MSRARTATCDRMRRTQILCPRVPVYTCNLNRDANGYGYVSTQFPLPTAFSWPMRNSSSLRSHECQFTLRSQAGTPGSSNRATAGGSERVTHQAARVRLRSCIGPDGPRTGPPPSSFERPRRRPFRYRARDADRSRRSNVALPGHPLGLGYGFTRGRRTILVMPTRRCRAGWLRPATVTGCAPSAGLRVATSHSPPPAFRDSSRRVPGIRSRQRSGTRRLRCARCDHLAGRQTAVPRQCEPGSWLRRRCYASGPALRTASRPSGPPPQTAARGTRCARPREQEEHVAVRKHPDSGVSVGLGSLHSIAPASISRWSADCTSFIPFRLTTAAEPAGDRGTSFSRCTRPPPAYRPALSKFAPTSGCITLAPPAD